MRADPGTLRRSAGASSLRAPGGATSTVVKYPQHTTLRSALNREINAYFTASGTSPHGGTALWIKTGVLIAWAVLSYLGLLLVAGSWWQVLIAATSLGLAVSGIGFNVMHDGGHGSYSSRPWGNRLTAWTLDLIGGSSYMWRFKHNVFHHQYPNVDGVDDDLEAGPWLRIAPDQPRYWFHRFQHLYAWGLYVFLPLKWQWWDDFKQAVTGRIAGRTFPRPRGWSLAGMLVGRAVFFGWALVLPLWLHPPLAVLGVYAFVCLITGITIATVFQLAHIVEEAEFNTEPASGERMPLPWAEHQLATTVDFGPNSRVLTWYLGGLNFQVEHHLFPKVSHVHYPAIEPIVRSVCAEFGVEHRSHDSVWGALGSHLRHMRKLGRAAA